MQLQAGRKLILLYGGTFDPVHNGHVALLWQVQQQLQADAVRLVPCFIPAHKVLPVTPVYHRLAMLQLVVDELNSATGCHVFTVDSQEVGRDCVSYSIDTLKACRQWCGPDVALVWLMGMDSWLQLITWHRWQELTDYTHLAVVERPGQAGILSLQQQHWSANKMGNLEALRQQAAGSIVHLQTTPLAIASSDLREQLQCGIRPLGLVPSVVDAYIQHHGLYSNSH